MKRFLIIPVILSALVSCGDKSTTEVTKVLASPSEVTVVQSSKTSAQVTWKDMSEGETGFSIFLTQDKADAHDRIGFTVGNATSYNVTKGLEDGQSYYFGIRADGNGAVESSDIAWSEQFTLVDPDRPQVVLQQSPLSLPAAVVVNYSFINLDNTDSPTCGVCWNTAGTPTVDDMHQDGPVLSKDSKGEMQGISNALLDYGKDYFFRAYLKSGEKVYYSNEVKGTLGEEPKPITLGWTKLDFTTLPSDIEVYETSDPLNGRNFHAWYAVADVGKGNVEFRVCMPDELTPVTQQYEDNRPDCLLLTNGAYFYGNYNIGVSAVNGNVQGSSNPMQGSLDLDNEPEEYYNYYQATRGIFGTDSKGSPSVYWVGTADEKNMFYDRPLPSIKGETKYAAVSRTMPSEPVSWSPSYAVTGGPVLLYDGKCPFDFTETARGEQYYYDNFELIPYDIFGPGVIPDRTAVGATADGKVIIFVCDGRIQESRGALLTELAMIMKGLGCVYAVNMDGGGSTSIVCEGKRLNSAVTNMDGTRTQNRAVKSTMGFFNKK